MKKTFNSLAILILLITLAAPALKKAPYIDIIVPNEFLGDNIVHHFPRISAAIEWCKKQKPPCTPRVWMPKKMGRMFQNTKGEIIVKEFIPYRIPDTSGDLTQAWETFNKYNQEYLRQLDLENSRGVWLSHLESTQEAAIRQESYHDKIKALLENETNKPVNYLLEVEGVDDNVRVKSNPKKTGVYNISEDNLKRGVPGMDGLEITDEKIRQWRQRSAMMLCPDDRQKLVEMTIKKHFPARHTKPGIFLNLNGSKPQTSLFKNGRAKRLLNELIRKHGKNTNIIIANMDELLRNVDFMSDPQIIEEIRDFIKYVHELNLPGVKILPATTKNYFSVVDSFLADPHTLVVTTDTGPYHLAATLKNDPDKVVSIFNRAKNPAQNIDQGFGVKRAQSSIASWGSPNARNIALDSLQGDEILSSVDPTIQQKLGQMYKSKFLKRIATICK